MSAGPARRRSTLPLAQHAAAPSSSRKPASVTPLVPTVAATSARPAKATRRAGELPAARPFAEHHRGNGDGEEGLKLQRDRGEPRRHADRHGGKQQAELADEERAADGDQRRPGNRRLGQDEHRQRGKHEAQGGEQERRKIGQRQPHEDEVQPPDEGERDGEDDMAGLQGKSTGWEGQPLCTRTARLNRAAGPRPVRSARPAAPRHKKRR